MVYLCQEGSHEQVILDVRLVLGLLELLNQLKLAFVVDATAEGGQGAGTEQRDAWTAVNVRLSQITQLVEENPAREQIGRVRAALSATRCLPRNVHRCVDAAEDTVPSQRQTSERPPCKRADPWTTPDARIDV